MRTYYDHRYVHIDCTHILHSYRLVLHAQLSRDDVTHAAHVRKVTGEDERAQTEGACRHKGVLRESEGGDASEAEGAVASRQRVWKSQKIGNF